jgi:multicomponent Na+:H+ antiporter subunit F
MVIACVICLYRLIIGPSNADRIIAIDNMGYMASLLLASIGWLFERFIYVDIALLICMVSFIEPIIFAKYIEGKRLGE